MYRNCTAVHRIIRHFKKWIAGSFNRRIIAGNKKMTFAVVSSGTSYNVNKLLIYLVNESVRFCLAICAAPRIPKTFPTKFFILRFKNKAVAVIFKAIANLFPHSCITLHRFVFIIGKSIDPAIIVVNIDNCVHIGIKSPIDKFLDS